MSGSSTDRDLMVEPQIRQNRNFSSGSQ